ncbi:MAG: diheme cytochrome c [Proteobacteria bacterium]|jgi:nitrate/TMAO reductase-like tetraheme cytochrome c subunit|uniref:Diheme cytochrome c n=2 Tax=Desulfovibrionaceae TaxID=194924 RepID=E6VX06_PSEA9|nr:Diheme cytochrome c [Pseudodesulfovibrio aespoeensis Aspo-2]MBU4245372.1 diheme cytochrome c [Pseudomonadota bacterium]MBU4558706.1 diheme cytochrome c [Pseudomonadota bacterium]
MLLDEKKGETMCKSKLLVGLIMITCFLSSIVALADDHNDRRKHRKDHHDREEVEDAVPSPKNELYLSVCGSCHMAYPPGLLNSASWAALIQGASEHFGEDLSLDTKDAEELETYLTSGASENVQGELARDISRDLGNRIVKRITEIPEIRKEHHELSASVFSRTSIGGLSNCIACHKRADVGVFDDDEVSIPRE